jgi:hypothetical protein
VNWRLDGGCRRAGCGSKRVLVAVIPFLISDWGDTYDFVGVVLSWMNGGVVGNRPKYIWLDSIIALS